MKHYSINAQQWIMSAENATEIINGELDILFNQEQREYLEDMHMKPLDEFCERRFDKMPHTYKFEEFNDGTDDEVYLCTALF